MNMPPVPIYKKESTLLDTETMKTERMDEEAVLNEAMFDSERNNLFRRSILRLTLVLRANLTV